MQKKLFLIALALGLAFVAAACGGKTSGGSPAVCGNGSLEAGEECDDGDLGDATCETLGLVGGTLACTQGCTFDVSSCTGDATCGDGVRQYPEQCDASDLAGASCTDYGFDGGELACDGSCRLDTDGCTGEPPCGDGLLAPGEQCDGDNLDGQTCESLVMGTGTLVCGDDCRFDTSGCSDAPVCGDNVAEGAEACDGSDLRSSDCVDAGFSGGTLACESDCTFDVSGCFVDELCGNGTLEPGEACDGSDLDGETCQSQGFLGGDLACDISCGLDTTACVAQICGNGTVEGSESCDGTNLGGLTCVSLGYDGGILACASTCDLDESGCQSCTSSDADAPIASGHQPAPETRGYPGDGIIAVDLFDACGVDLATISMTLEITPPLGAVELRPVSPVVSGSGSHVSLSFTPATPLPPGSIIVVTVTADDVNCNTMIETWRYSVLDTITLYTGGPGGMSTMNQLDEANPSTNISGFAESFVCGGDAPGRQRVIIRFINNIPDGALVLEASLYLARCPGDFAATTIECYGMRVESEADRSTWNARYNGPPGPTILWNTPGADGVPADRTGTMGASVHLPASAQNYLWEVGPATVLATEWSTGQGSEQMGMLCTNANPTTTSICSPFSNGPPQMRVVIAPALP